MIITIRLTDEAIQYLQKETGVDLETAEEIAQMVVLLCEKSGSPTPKYQKERKLLEEVRELIARHKDDSDFESFVQGDALRLESSLEQFFDLYKTEGERSDPRIPDLARDVIERYKWAVLNPIAPIDGTASFEASLMRLEKALQEGEGR